MWLTRVLLGHRFRSAKVPGVQFIGKHRRFRPITKYMIRNLEERLAVEEENAKHLSRPFLTKEEEYCHAQERRARLKEEFKTVRHFSKAPPNQYIDDHLAHLRVSKKWE
ncbi:large ribosomal subunit protein mL63-like [Lytechinus pictus]|uniref:large ribosomal subunit protein mL63-like n=1 Tax=Lytechinus pictus TaxID=7653 RepID=UPI00240DEC50|nr:ribosomal protein 63, mitochondrial-like [Lytechinus pictus]